MRNQLIRHRLPRDRILPKHHDIQKVIQLRPRVRPPLGNDTVADAVHVLDVLRHPPPREVPQRVLDGEAVGRLPRLDQRLGHGRHEARRLLGVEAVEAVVHGAQADDVEREPREVVGPRDLVVRAQAVPLEDHLRRAVDHLVEHAPHRDGAHRWDQDAVAEVPFLW